MKITNIIQLFKMFISSKDKSVFNHIFGKNNIDFNLYGRISGIRMWG